MKDFFWTTISCVKGIGSKTFIDLYEQYPHLNFDNLSEAVQRVSKKSLVKLLAEENIKIAKEKADTLLQSHKEKGISVIPISSEWYPNLLRLIPDPPPLLFAKGNLDLLQSPKNIAIVGTRKPTNIGVKAAGEIAATFAEKGYTIVSGLALGIDTAAHEGALRVEGGKTIAVLAGSLTNIYPAKNRELAKRILVQDGLLLSETPLGQPNSRGNFVKRNRIQSGLSLAVCPVQTPLKSGTQHTIEYSRKHGRLLFTPIPREQDLEEDAIQGNLELINNGVTVLKDSESYREIEDILLQYKEKLADAHKARFEQKREQLNLFD